MVSMAPPQFPFDQRPAIFLLWLRLSTPLYQRLSRNIIREVYSYKCVDDLIPFLQGSHLAVYNLSTGTAVSFPKPAHLPAGAFFCLVTKVLAVVLPCEQPSRETAILDLARWKCEDLRRFRESKRRPAAIAVDEVVYTFGGLNDCFPSISCDQLCVQEKVWRRMGDLSRCCCPSACHYEGRIYLPDTSPFDRMDVYNIHFAQFTTVVVETQLPWMPVSILSEGVMTLLGAGKQLARRSLKKAMRRMEELRTDCAVGPGSCQPIRDGKQWYWVQADCLMLHSFAPASLKVVSRLICIA